MRRLVVTNILLSLMSAASAQTIAPVPDYAEGGAPRPPRAEGISSALAVEAAQVAVAACQAVGLNTTALVVDSAGAPIVMISADGTPHITQRIASGKARAAVKLGVSSGEAQAKARNDAALMASFANDPTMGPPYPGAFPIVVAGKTLGALAVSGAPTGAQDEPCAKAGVTLIKGRLAARTEGVPALPSSAAITFVLPQDLKFEGAPGEKRAKLYGDPEKPGPYAIIYQWEPGHNSKPHTHAIDRFGYVISGTWWMSSAAVEDKSTLYPVPAGSFVTHKAGQVHWDGGVDNTALVLVTGIGPIQTTRLSQPAKAEAEQREIVVGTPGFTYNGGLDIITKAFQEETGIKVTVKYGGMEKVMGYGLEGSIDAVFLPAESMDEIAARNAIKAGTRKRIGRSYQGLAVRKGGHIPDISSKEKFIAALETANLVLHSRCEQSVAAGTTGCTRTAQMITDMFKRPEFAKVKSAPSAFGEGGAALARNEGDMAIQNISQIIIWDNLVVVGAVPEELGMYMDGVAAVPAKAKNPALGQQFIEYATQQGAFPIWWSRGIDPRKGRE